MHNTNKNGEDHVEDNDDDDDNEDDDGDVERRMTTRMILTMLIMMMIFFEFATVTQHRKRGWNRTCVPVDINPFITNPTHKRLYHNTRVYAPYSLRTVVWVLLRRTRIRTAKELWDEAYGFSSLSEKIRLSNHL